MIKISNRTDLEQPGFFPIFQCLYKRGAVNTAPYIYHSKAITMKSFLLNWYKDICLHINIL